VSGWNAGRKGDEASGEPEAGPRRPQQRDLIDIVIVALVCFSGAGAVVGLIALCFDRTVGVLIVSLSIMLFVGAQKIRPPPPDIDPPHAPW
jgi:hypothetical protein